MLERQMGYLENLTGIPQISKADYIKEGLKKTVTEQQRQGDLH